MPTLGKVVLKNFKRFRDITLEFDKERTLLIGDNESGKSSILLAIDLVLSASRSRAESVGLETLFHRTAINEFLAGDRKASELPEVLVELYLSDGLNPDINGENNSLRTECDGLKMICRPDIKYGAIIAEVLAAPERAFPFEFYDISFQTFQGNAYVGQKKFVRHLHIDSSRIDSDYATREYTKSVFEVHTEDQDRIRLEHEYRSSKSAFSEEHLTPLKKDRGSGRFALRTNAKANLESDLILVEDGIPVEAKGKGRQCFVKTEFALNKSVAKKAIDIVLLEEPENHLSHVAMRKLVDQIQQAKNCQLILATHSSLISSRLDLRKTILLSPDLNKNHGRLKDLSKETAEFFMKAPDNNVLEFVLSRRVILVEGDAEYMLMDAFFRKPASPQSLNTDDVHVIAVGGTSFKRYMELADLLNIKTAVIRDNDHCYQETCVDRYTEHVRPHIQVFGDRDDNYPTFETCIYRDNRNICEELFHGDRRTRTVLEYMLAEKAEAAFALLNKKEDSLIAPAYVQDAIAWIRS